MKKAFFLFFSLLSVCGFAQGKLDFSDITKNVQDSTSSYFYEKLTYQFIYRPTSLDSAEAKHLYYGQFKGKKLNTPLRSNSFSAGKGKQMCGGHSGRGKYPENRSSKYGGPRPYGQMLFGGR